MSEPSLLYLHGFLSSPASQKAREAQRYAQECGLQDRLTIPALDAGPAATIAALQDWIAGQDCASLGVIGSSLGGFYASVLAESHDLPVVLINPAVQPHQYWRSYLGSHRNYHTDSIHEVTAQHVAELEALDPGRVSRPENYLVFLQRQDEVLDYQQAVNRFGVEQCIIRDDGSHAYEGFRAELPVAFRFLLSRISARVR
jgi:predicted esterase YcpF (UPF0227 family)